MRAFSVDNFARLQTRDDATRLSQIAAKSLDAFAGIIEIGGLGRVGNPECRTEPERRTLHHRDAFGLQQLGDEVLVIAEHLARRRRLADGAGAGRGAMEGAVRPRAIYPPARVEPG